MYGNKFNSQQEANVACAKAPKEQTVGELLGERWEYHAKEHNKLMITYSSLPAAVRGMPVSEFRKLSNLL